MGAHEAHVFSSTRRQVRLHDADKTVPSDRARRGKREVRWIPCESNRVANFQYRVLWINDDDAGSHLMTKKWSEPDEAGPRKERQSHQRERSHADPPLDADSYRHASPVGGITVLPCTVASIARPPYLYHTEYLTLLVDTLTFRLLLLLSLYASDLPGLVQLIYFSSHFPRLSSSHSRDRHISRSLYMEI